ncbi:molybdopterin guanine dinucleotide-containing S/N-oxide reductase [Actinomycetospora chlora]|uniref:Molybdopterin guanine dinucleotide-containing S/N-oxide reductase n=1 Tax=Actinomycetospora chlora TaxID=663608 RepID=A0ABP9AH46_9PSEU
MTIHAGHWGAYRPRVSDDGRLVAAEPFEGDADPSPLLGSLPGAVHARNRVLRPAVRASWLRGERGRRGADPFVEVPWDHALDLVADALARTHADHGPQAVLGGSYGWSSAGRLHHAKTQLNHFLACLGGYTGQVSNYSYGAADRLLPHVLGDTAAVTGQLPTWDDVAAATDTLLMLGGAPAKNVQVESGGTGEHAARLGLARVLDAGTRVVNVNPVRTDAPDHPAVTWVPIRPGADTALLLALMRWLDAHDAVDEDFVARCTTGDDRLRAYLRGRSDGVDKTPEWAAALTGVPAATIAALARRLAAGRSLVTATWALQRAEHGEQPYWAVIALASYLGQIGLPGGGFGFGYGCVAGVGGTYRPFGTPAFHPRPNPCRSRVPVARLADLLLHPGEEYAFDGATHRYPDVRLVYWAGGNPFHHHQDLNRLARAWQRPETVVVHEPWWTPTARMADVVLPATTTLERDDIAASSRDPWLVAMKRTLDPPGEARHDRAILTALAERLGIGAEYTVGRDDAAALRAMYEQARRSAAGHGHALPSFDAFWAVGHHRYDLPAPPPPFADFRRSPSRARLATPSGRIELFSATVDGFGYDDCPGHPTWLPPASWLGAATERHPIHLLSPQPGTRLHSQLDMGAVSAAAKVAGREPCVVSRADADARGITDGDVLRVWNDRGETHAGAVVSDDVVPGVALLATGAWYTPLDPSRDGSPELHGNPNVLTADVPTSRLAQATAAQSVLVQVERVTSAPHRDPHALPAFVDG